MFHKHVTPALSVHRVLECQFKKVGVVQILCTLHHVIPSLRQQRAQAQGPFKVPSPCLNCAVPLLLFLLALSLGVRMVSKSKFPKSSASKDSNGPDLSVLRNKTDTPVVPQPPATPSGPPAQKQQPPTSASGYPFYSFFPLALSTCCLISRLAAHFSSAPR